MGRNATRAASRIKAMCKAGGYDEKELYQRAKLLLEIYRDVCWSSSEQAEEAKRDIVDYSIEYCSGTLDSALLYLETFASDEARERFEEKVSSLFEISWMIDIVDSAMIKVKECPVNGELYSEILSTCYLSYFTYTEPDLLELFNMDRSTFYRRKREAIKVFGLSLWGKSLFEYRSIAIPKASDVQLTVWDM